MLPSGHLHLPQRHHPLRGRAAALRGARGGRGSHRSRHRPPRAARDHPTRSTSAGSTASPFTAIPSSPTSPAGSTAWCGSGSIPRQERIASWEVLERHHPRFVQPTTGEVAGDLYYYIANAQLRRFRDGKILPWDSLAPVLVLKTDLSEAPVEGRRGGAGKRSGAGRRPGAAAAVRWTGGIVWSEGFGAPGSRHREAGCRRDEIRHRQHLQDAHPGGGPRRWRMPAGSTSTHRWSAISPTSRTRGGASRSGASAPTRAASRTTSPNDHYWSTAHFELDSAYRLIAAAPMTFSPGTRTEYATGLFTIVGRVLERVGRESYPEVMRRTGARAGRHDGDGTQRPAAAAGRRARVLRERRSRRLRAGARHSIPASSSRARASSPRPRTWCGSGWRCSSRGCCPSEARREMFTPVAARGRHTDPLRARLPGAGGRRPAAAAAIRRRARDRELARDLSRRAAWSSPSSPTPPAHRSDHDGAPVAQAFLTPPAPAPSPRRPRASAQAPSPPPAR